jgi:ABC-type transport system involved in multi-copper enzyme maturation permease subunit
MALLLWWIMVAFAAITLLGSTLTRSAIAAAGIGIVALIVMGILGALPVIGPYMPSSLAGPAQAIALGLDPGWIAGPLLFNVLLVPVLFFVTWLVFRRQEL